MPGGRLPQLVVGQPLQPLEELDPFGVLLTETGDRLAFGIAEGFRPFLPHPLALTLEEMLVQGVETRLTDQGLIHFPLEQQEGIPALSLSCACALEQQFQHRHLQVGDGGVIDQVSFTNRAEPLLEIVAGDEFAGLRAMLKFRQAATSI